MTELDRVKDLRRREAAIRKRLRDRGVDVDGKEQAVTRYARALQLAEVAFDEIGESVTSLGANGQEVVDPAFRAWVAADKAAAEFGAALGLEPVKAAGQPGRPAGAASAADRKGVMAAPKLTRVK